MSTEAGKRGSEGLASDQPQELRLPWRAWSGGVEEEVFRFPGSWTVERLEMTGWSEASRPDLGPLTVAVRTHAKGCETASIAVEDPTRPSALEPVLRAVVDGLLGAGIGQTHIDIVMAVGAHGEPPPAAVRQKVGDWVAERFQIRVHDPAGALADTGIRVGRIPLRIDASFRAANFRVGVGSIIPNPFAGFSGGGKIVLPGLASIDVLEWLHKLGMMGFAGGVGRLDGNRIRAEIDRVGQTLPLHFSIGCLVDAGREIRELHYGEPQEAHRSGCARARLAYATQMSGRYDILFCNAYPKDAEFLQAENAYNPLRTGGLEFLSEGGSVVLMAACHSGRGRHGLFDRGMPLHRNTAAPKGYLRGAQGLVCAPGITEEDCRVTHWEGYPFLRSWDELIDTLARRHGSAARVGVFPAASCQLGPGSTA